MVLTGTPIQVAMEKYNFPISLFKGNFPNRKSCGIEHVDGAPVRELVR